MTLKVGIIGPTNMKKLSKLTGKPEAFFLKKAEVVGNLLASHGCDVWVNSDGGMVSGVAHAYKEAGGKNLVMLYPKKGEPWPNKHAKPHVRNADKLKILPNWFWTNYQVVTAPDVCICVGLSSGTLSELAYIKWNHQFNRGRLKHLVVLQELVRGRRIPPEIEVEVKDILLYCKSMRALDVTLKRFTT
jgi:predicted Rossmann-fold nucleotide-binding protein